MKPCCQKHYDRIEKENWDKVRFPDTLPIHHTHVLVRCECGQPVEWRPSVELKRARLMEIKYFETLGEG